MDSSTYAYDEEIRPISKIEFTVLGNDEIKQMSALGKDSIGIDIPDLYDNMEPKRGGLIDTRLGTVDPHIDCATCGLNTAFCVGHFGHIDLAEPVFHMGYIDFVKKILSCVCLKCSKLLIYKNEDELADMLKNKSEKKRFAEIRNIAKNVSYCLKSNYGCGTPVSKIKKEIKKTTCQINIISETNLTGLASEGGDFDGKKKIRRILTPDDCYNILKNISDTDCKIIGLDPTKTRPEMMIHKIFPVPPVQVRPSVKADFLASSSMEDDLTHKLADIIKANIRIRKYKESLNDVNAKYSQDHQHLLQYHIATYYNNDSLCIPKAEQRGKVTKSLESRLKGKEGRIRSNLMGKRVDFSARTVITPDPTIEINQLGIPIKVAMNLTFPEVVTPFNIEHLQSLVRNGRDVYPGANFVFPISSMSIGDTVLPIDLRYRKGKVELRFGDVVERHLVDGDFVLLNRQPTLHKLSMMGHRIKVINNDNLRTFRLNPSVTTPYNADFDGDEMNIFVPQSLQTQIELAEIADVKRQIITPRLSTPIIGIVQDGLLGAYNLTAPSMRVHWKDAMNMISYTTFDKLDSFKKNIEYKGSDIFSMIVPPEINTTGKVEIKKGHLISGRITSEQLGAKKADSLIHMIYDQYGMDETKTFIDNTIRLINNFNFYNGFTVGIGDIYIPLELEKQMNKLFETKKLEVNHIITEMENNPNLYDFDTFEQSIYSELNNIRETVSKLIMNNLDPMNNFNIMLSSGSKGAAVNMGQMGGCIGQQVVEAKRILKKINGRTLPYYYQNDDSAVARGFVEEPFVNGMTPQSFIFHNMGSREGLIDTAIKSVTGDTPIIILDGLGKSKRVLIGDWIDGLLDENKENVQHYKERDMELLELKEMIYIPTSDELGNVTWGTIKNITRHDPGLELYKIKTLGGRDVIVTESKSLLIWNSDMKQFVRMSTPDVKVGDYVPTTMYLPEPPTKYNVNINITDNNNLPDELFAATIDSVSCYLSNYICKFGKFNNTSIKLESPINEFLISFNMLLSRLGIFGEIRNNILSINSKYADKLVKTLNIPYEFKLIDNSDFTEQNDVVLDQIVSIEKVDISLYPKVYDLTIPSTLNFGLANGLHVVDTAESGYIQRKLIKSMEDAMVKYDLTVRNSNNTIIQFSYGDNGIDTTKQSNHALQLIMMGNKEIEEQYKFTSQELKNFTSYSSKDNDEYFINLLNMRDQMRSLIRASTISYIKMKTNFMLPVDLKRIISDGKNSDLTSKEKLEPKYILQKIEELLNHKNTRLFAMSSHDSNNNSSLKHRDELASKTMFRFALYEYLSPKICLFKNNLNKAQFDNILDKIVISFNRSVVEAGEMIGTIAAQSIGEPVTQLTLNSIDWKDKIFVDGNVIEIGKYIDDFIDNNKDRVKRLEDNPSNEMGDTYYVNIENMDIETLSVDKNGKISWNRITALTKHLPMNADGTNDLVKVKTRLGKEITATKAKSFLTRINNEIIPIRGDEIKIGTMLPVMKGLCGIIDNPPNIIPGNNLNCVSGDVHIDKIKELLNTDLNEKDRYILQNIINSNVYYDEIVEITHVKPTNKYVYDLTVENDKTFVTASGICCYDTFHHSGIGGKGTATLGVPRMKELLSFSKNMKTPVMSIYLEESIRHNKDIADKIASYVKYTTISDIRKKVDVYYDPKPFKKGGFMEKDHVYNVFYKNNPTKNSCQPEITNLPWLMRIELDKEKMMDKEITLLDIKSKFCNNWEKRYVDMKGVRKDEKQLLEKITQCAILSNNENDRLPIIHVRFDMKDFNYSTITGFLDVFIETFKLKGIEGILSINSVNPERILDFNNKNQEKQELKQNVIYTEGVNLDAIRYINGIDLNITMCNDVVEVYQKYGIEAARAVLLHEINMIFESSGGTVNYQHISVLVDIMTNSGILTSVDRHGLNKLDTDPLSRASFEKTVDQFIQAAVFGEADSMQSVSSRIMAGLAIKGGTGLCDVILDTSTLENSEYIEDTDQKYRKTYNDLDTNIVMDDVLSKATSSIFIPE